MLHSGRKPSISEWQHVKLCEQICPCDIHHVVLGREASKETQTVCLVCNIFSESFTL